MEEMSNKKCASAAQIFWIKVANQKGAAATRLLYCTVEQVLVTTSSYLWDFASRFSWRGFLVQYAHRQSPSHSKSLRSTSGPSDSC